MNITKMTEEELIQEVKRLQELEMNLNKYQQYFDTAAVVMLVLDEDGNISKINKKGSQVLGYRENELIGKNWFETCVPKNTREERFRSYKERNATNVISDPYYEGAVLTKSGRKLPLSFYTSLLIGDDGETKGIITCAVDTSERKKAE